MQYPRQVREQAIGPFKKYDEAVTHIRQFALALTNLGLNKRFVVNPVPQPVTESVNGRTRAYYQVILIDREPDRPAPPGLTALRIKAAESRGYKKPRNGSGVFQRKAG